MGVSMHRRSGCGIVAEPALPLHAHSASLHSIAPLPPHRSFEASPAERGQVDAVRPVVDGEHKRLHLAPLKEGLRARRTWNKRLHQVVQSSTELNTACRRPARPSIPRQQAMPGGANKHPDPRSRRHPTWGCAGFSWLRTAAGAIGAVGALRGKEMLEEGQGSLVQV